MLAQNFYSRQFLMTLIFDLPLFSKNGPNFCQLQTPLFQALGAPMLPPAPPVSPVLHSSSSTHTSHQI